MFNRSGSMKGELPMERQAVQVKINDGDWQPATYQDGQFVDSYGLPLDAAKISAWKPVGGAVGARPAAPRSVHAGSVPAQRVN
jgi:hypothetical protein